MSQPGSSSDVAIMLDIIALQVMRSKFPDLVSAIQDLLHQGYPPSYILRVARHNVEMTPLFDAILDCAVAQLEIEHAVEAAHAR